MEEEGLDAVRLMTIHRAKGLEFHTVCVADLGRSARSALRSARLGRRPPRAAAAAVGDVGASQALDYDALGAEERERAEERAGAASVLRRDGARAGAADPQRGDALRGLDRRPGPKGGGTVAWVAPAFLPELAAGSRGRRRGGARQRPG